jgi:hypothetical protein
MEQSEKEPREVEEAMESMLYVLLRAYRDPIRPKIRVEGMDERDLAYEAGLLTPVEMETSVYGTQKRGRVLRLVRKMVERSWIDMEPTPPQGAYHIFLKQEGVDHATEKGRFVLDRLLRWLKGRLGYGPPRQTASGPNSRNKQT